MAGEAPTISPGGLDHELSALRDAHGAVTEALGRMFDAVYSGRETLIGIERLRLQNCVDLYRIHAAEIQAAFKLCARQAEQRDDSDESDHLCADELLVLHRSLGQDQSSRTKGHVGDRPVAGVIQSAEPTSSAAE
jgi:hypothetical protein